MSHEPCKWFIVILGGIHFQSSLPTLRQTQNSLAKRKVSRPPDGIRSIDSKSRLRTFGIIDMLYIPDFDGFVKGAGDDLIAPMMGPVYTVNLEAVSFELSYR